METPNPTPPATPPAPAPPAPAPAYVPPVAPPAPPAPPEGSYSAGGFLGKVDWVETGWMAAGTFGLCFVIYYFWKKQKLDKEYTSKLEKAQQQLSTRVAKIEAGNNSNVTMRGVIN